MVIEAKDSQNLDFYEYKNSSADRRFTLAEC
jgi:hypothetical protein